MRTQLHCGFILSCVSKVFSDIETPIEPAKLLEDLCCFEIDFNFNKEEKEDSLLSVFDNYISRGLPTLASILIEETITNQFNFSKKEVDEKRGEIHFKPTQYLKDVSDLIYRSLFIIDSRIKPNHLPNISFGSWEEHSPSDYEVKFFQKSIPQLFHSSICQLIEPQREIKSILNDNFDKLKNHLGHLEDSFIDQRLDFCLDFPDDPNHLSGIAIEIDGTQHENPQQKTLDKYRDNALISAGWEPTVRILTKTIDQIPEDQIKRINNYLMHPYAQKIIENYESPVWSTNEGKMAMQVVLSPLGIARIEKTILYLIKRGVLDLNAQTWKIAVVERDVPCATLAFQDLKSVFSHLFKLENAGRHLPKIILRVYQTSLFKNNSLNQDNWEMNITKFNPSEDFDAVLDISLLQRVGFDYPVIENINSSQSYIKIRSSHSKKTRRIIQSAKPIKYSLPEEEQPAYLIYFLNNIFRKVGFREGQLDIIRRTLALESVIALLPTGAGKSLTYQLSALLQPGLVLIIDPLKSLMRDQDQNLREINIDSSVFINSSVKANDRKRLSQEMMQGFYKFIFVSPERLQIEEFRSFLQKMKGAYFSYCVVDEAHCVSEWGHDFRTAYLRLGENVQKHCLTLGDKLPIIGLTGTASFDVLEDVQRELNIRDELSIIKPSEYKRNELKFKIENVENIDKHSGEIKRAIAEAKYQHLEQVINNLPNLEWSNKQKYDSLEIFFSSSSDSKYEHCGIVFCPHVNWFFGVHDVENKIKETIPFLKGKTSIYAGSLDDSDIYNLEQIQKEFKSNKLGLLVATKAFGMGIDKPNIRFTIHFSMPQSIEAFYQEAGRAGRDGDDAYCYILYSPKEMDSEDDGRVTVDKSLMLSFFHESFPGIEKEKYVIWDLLNKIEFPEKNINSKLNEVLVNNELDDEFIINFWKNSNHHRMYVNDTNSKSYGYIDLHNLQTVPEQKEEKKVVEPEEARIQLNQLLDRLKDRCPSGYSFTEWICNEEQPIEEPGLESILTKLNNGESQKVTIPFTNNRIVQITNFLKTFDTSWSENMVHNAKKFCYEPEMFIKKLKSEYSREPENFDKQVKFSETQQNSLAQMFKHIRGEQETHRAIYRLSIIGVIEDYVVDYNSKTISATIRKRSDEEYLDNLIDYIKRYESPETISKVKNDILKSKGRTIIQKCCGYLIHFVYEKIASKRKEAIDVMERAIKVGIESGGFEDYVNTYFDSRFTPEFRKKLRENKIDWVWTFLDEQKNNLTPDTISHIRGACDRLLVENPDNPALLLLRAYAKFTNPNYNKNEAAEDLRKGLRNLIQINGMSWRETLSVLSQIYKYVINFDKNLSQFIEKTILFIHKEWLIKFNKKFLEEYKNA